jgi:hypothetical protein
VSGLVVGHSLRLSVLGILLGLGRAFAVTRVMRTMLVAVSSTDPLTIASIPGHRISRLQPVGAAGLETGPDRGATRGIGAGAASGKSARTVFASDYVDF